MIDPSLVLFAIEAGARLGRKINEVLIDETAERPLLMPLGELAGSIAQVDANDFFDAHLELLEPGGPCHHFNDQQKLEYYRSMVVFQDRVYAGLGDPTEIIRQLHGLEQFRKGFGAKPAARRLAGTIVEIGIDFFVAHPDALGRDSAARRVVHAFVVSLDDTDFAEGAGKAILQDLLCATLRTLGESVSLVEDDRRVQALVGGVTKALAEDIKKTPLDGHLGRQQLFRRIGSSLLRGGAAAFTENLDLFIPADAQARGLVQSALTQVLAGLRGSEDLFTNETIELIFQSALRATAENPEVFTKNEVLRQLIQRSVSVLADKQWDTLFAQETAGGILHAALEVARENMETLIKPDSPQEQIVADALAAMAASLSRTLAGTGKIHDLISREQLIDLTHSVLGEVARHPENLLGGKTDDPGRTVLAQVIGSVAGALGKDPKRFVNGDTFMEIVGVALHEVVLNADQLIDLASPATKTNPLFNILQQIAAAIREDGDSRGLVGRDVFADIVRRILPVASANVGALVGNASSAVQLTVGTALGLAAGTFKTRINGANLPVLIEGLLRDVVWDRLNLDETKSVATATERILANA